jgi:ATP-dependent RNA helicase DHX29
MPIPKQTAYSGTTPKATLKSLVTKAFKSAVILYASLSGGSRAARAGVEIRFNAKRRSVTKMEDIACDDMAQAENYVSTLVLHDLQMRGDIPQVTWRTFPPAYRDLWEELDVQWKEKEDGKRREIWRKLRGMYDKKAVATSEANGMTVATSATSDAIANGSAKAKVDYIERLQHDFHRRIATPAYQKMRPQRDGLPIASFRQQILDTIDRNQVMVLSGETGCGKSTQLPAYILEDQMAKGKPCKIYVTEPRRISAISLAQRVSAELGDAPGQMGTSSSLVGYSIRLEAKVSAQTRLAFVTNGIALRMLEAGSAPGKATAFDEVTHIVVDEVHERSIDSDFLLIVLRSLMQQRPDLKVILMSATLDADKISNYFGGCPYLAVPGRTFPVQVNYLEDAVQAADWHIDESSHYAVRHRHVKGGKQLEWTEDTPQNSDSEDEKEQDPTKLSAAKYSPKTVSTVNLLDSRQIPYDLIVRLLERICFEDGQYKPFSAATLVFMPGLAEIRKLNDMLLGHPAFGSQDFMVYPLHSTVSSEGQQAVFDIPPPGIRKIVICKSS